MECRRGQATIVSATRSMQRGAPPGMPCRRPPSPSEHTMLTAPDSALSPIPAGAERRDRTTAGPSQQVAQNGTYGSGGSSRATVVTLSMLLSKEATIPTPLRSALATRYASAKSSRSIS